MRLGVAVRRLSIYYMYTQSTSHRLARWQLLLGETRALLIQFLISGGVEANIFRVWGMQGGGEQLKGDQWWEELN